MCLAGRTDFHTSVVKSRSLDQNKKMKLTILGASGVLLSSVAAIPLVTERATSKDTHRKFHPLELTKIGSQHDSRYFRGAPRQLQVLCERHSGSLLPCKRKCDFGITDSLSRRGLPTSSNRCRDIDRWIRRLVCMRFSFPSCFSTFDHAY